jgi:hypothetical protein
MKTSAINPQRPVTSISVSSTAPQKKQKEFSPLQRSVSLPSLRSFLGAPPVAKPLGVRPQPSKPHFVHTKTIGFVKPKVATLTPKEKKDFAIRLQRPKGAPPIICDHKLRPLHTGEHVAKFVMTPQWKIFGGVKKTFKGNGSLHHATLASERTATGVTYSKVAAAGTARVIDGVLRWVTDDSSIRPNFQMTLQFLGELERQGISLRGLPIGLISNRGIAWYDAYEIFTRQQLGEEIPAPMDAP